MNIGDRSGNGAGRFCLAAAFLCEAGAALPLFASARTWFSWQDATLCHIAAGLLAGVGAATICQTGTNWRQWVGCAVLFGLFAIAIPYAGLFAVVVMVLVLQSHRRRIVPDLVKLRAVPNRPSRSSGLVQDTFGASHPLVTVLEGLGPENLREIALGLDSLPVRHTRPLLKKLQKNPDVHVQLFANGLLNDQLDKIERQLADLKMRAEEDPDDEQAHIAIVESYSHLFENKFVAADEMVPTARLALRECRKALALNPNHPVVLAAKVQFHFFVNDLAKAADVISRLYRIPGQEARAEALHARLLYRCAAVPPGSGSVAPHSLPIRSQFRIR